MNREEILKRWPNASESLIRANLGWYPIPDEGKVESTPVFYPKPLQTEPGLLIQNPGANPFKTIPVADWLADVDLNLYERKELSFTIKVKPIGAVRMNRSDVWRKPVRPEVGRYRIFKEIMRLAVRAVATPDAIYLKAYIPMWDSWSEKKKLAMDKQPHRQKPDGDNIIKAAQDSMFGQDCNIWMTGAAKYWTRAGNERIELRLVYFYRKDT